MDQVFNKELINTVNTESDCLILKYVPWSIYSDKYQEKGKTKHNTTVLVTVDHYHKDTEYKY